MVDQIPDELIEAAKLMVQMNLTTLVSSATINLRLQLLHLYPSNQFGIL